MGDWNCNNCNACNPKDCSCSTETCGCEFEVGSHCVRFCGEDLDCINVKKGENLEKILKAIDAWACSFIAPEDGKDGQGIDHVSFTSTTDGSGNPAQSGATDTYTVWGDVLETINLGTFQVKNGEDGVDGTDGDDIYDSGWKEINVYTAPQGFGMAPISNLSRPTIRIIGRQVYIKGIFYIPLAESASGGTTLASDFNGYVDTFNDTVDTYIGTDGGFSLNPNGNLESQNPIIPTDLFPDQREVIGLNVLSNRVILSEGGTRGLNLTTLLSSVYLNTNGKVQVVTQKDTDIPSVQPLHVENSAFHELIMDVSSGDNAIQYSGYQTSFSGGVDQRIVSDSGVAFPVTFDGEDEGNLGGFKFNFTFQYLLDPATPMADIQTAFNSI